MYKILVNRGNGWEPHPIFHCPYSEHDASEIVRVGNKLAKVPKSQFYGWKLRKTKSA